MVNIEVDASLPMSKETHVQEIFKMLEKQIFDWYSTVNTLGLEPHDMVKWQEELKGEFEVTANDCCAVARDKQQSLMDKIETLLEESQKMCKQLSIKLPKFEPTNKGLYNDEKYLISKVKDWQHEIQARTSEVDDLIARRDELVQTLGRKAFSITKSPLPSREELHCYATQIQDMEDEKNRRIELYRDLQEQIFTLSEEIQYSPRLDFERNIISGENMLFFEASDEYMARIKNFHNDLVEMRQSIEEDLNSCRKKLDDLWEVLEEDVKYRNDFVQSHIGNTFKTLEAFKEEVLRCENIRKANLGKFIHKLRQQLSELWDEAAYSKCQREEFAGLMQDQTFTEDLLTSHDIEIKKIETFLNKNQLIFDLMKQRDELYKRMKDLEERANAPDRFKNRGGQLLKEEKERKAVTKKIPCIEDQLLNLAIMYEDETGVKFTFWGDTIEELIVKSRETIEQGKQLQMSARKQKNGTMTATRLMIPRSIYKSPSITHLSNANFLTPCNKRTMLLTPRTAPVRRAITGRRSITKAKLRMSAERRKRISMDKKTRSAAMRQNMKVTRREQNENDIDYSRFESEVSSKGSLRSTINFNSPHARKLIPSIRVETPRSVNRALKCVASKAKLIF